MCTYMYIGQKIENFEIAQNWFLMGEILFRGPKVGKKRIFGPFLLDFVILAQYIKKTHFWGLEPIIISRKIENCQMFHC